MKGVPVKFRAKTEKGDFVYGDLIKGHYIEWMPKIKPAKKRSVHVDKDSVAQLIGYDADGKEIYEGDKLILGASEYIAGVQPVTFTNDGKYFKPEKDFSDFLLKE